MHKNDDKSVYLERDTLITVLLIAVLFIGTANFLFTLNLAKSVNSMPTYMNTVMKQLSSSNPKNSTVPLTTQQQESDEDVITQVAKEVIASGIPKIYGSELSVSFDNVQDAINKLSVYDSSIELEGTDKEKYIAIGTQISCEYCCGADSITFSNGEAACACAHSAAMRGLTKYLIEKHNDEFTAEQILVELQKWKSVFFPKQTIAKAVQVKAAQGEISDSDLQNLPDMVGGC